SGTDNEKETKMVKLKTLTIALLITVAPAFVAQAQKAKIDQHGWKLVYVAYNEEKKGDERPIMAFFVKDWPFRAGKEFPKLLEIQLSEDLGLDDLKIKHPASGVRKTLNEFDCNRNRWRTIRWYMTDGKVSIVPEPAIWGEIIPDTPAEAIFKY